MRTGRSWGNASPDGGPFRVLNVCRANHCRSPLMEHLLQDGADERELPWLVSSAGVEAAPGQPVHPYVGRILAKRGIATADWRSRQLTPALTQAADLILTATEAQRAEVVALDPEAEAVTFPILLFARLAPFARTVGRYSPAEFGPWLMAEANRLEGRYEPVRSNGRDIADPLGRPFNDFKRCADLIDSACVEIFARCPNRLER